jgi:hypothetical protein
MAAISELPDSLDQLLIRCISKSQSRVEFWVEFIKSIRAQRMVEVGV